VKLSIDISAIKNDNVDLLVWFAGARKASSCGRHVASSCLLSNVGLLSR